MKVIGLTGSIGMGKSTVTEMFAELGAATWNADTAVHRLYDRGGAAVAPVSARFPGAITEGIVDREKLSKIVLDDAGALAALEEIVHPLVAADREAAIATARQEGAPMIVLDIPLLFENGSKAPFDAVIVVSATPEVQQARVLKRPGMTREKFHAIVARQLPDAVKKRNADFTINTGVSLDATKRAVGRLYAQLTAS